jgi:tetratricopeptide (TPR) repeat protein
MKTPFVFIVLATTLLVGCRTAVPQELITAVRTGDAKEILREAHNIAKANDVGDGIISEIAIAQAKLDDFQAALDTMKTMRGESGKETVLLDIAKARARVGQIQNALRDIEEYSICLRFEVLLEYAEAQVKVGNGKNAQSALKEAFSRSKEIPYCIQRLLVLTEIAAIQNKAANQSACESALKKSIEDTKIVDDNFDRAFGWMKVGRVQAQAGLKDEAIQSFQTAVKAADMIEGYLAGSNRACIFKQIAVAQAEAGHIAEALETVARISDKEDGSSRWDKRGAIASIALMQLHAGNMDGALETVQLIEEKYDSEYVVLIEIAEVQAKAHDTEGALNTSELIKDASSRKAQATLRIATAQAEAGDVEKACETAGSIRCPLTRRDNILPLAYGGEPFDYAKPETWGSPFEAPGYFSMSSYWITMEIAGDLAADAMRFYRTVNNEMPSFKNAFKDCDASVLRKIAVAQTETGDAEGALKWALKLDDPHQTIYALLGIVEGLTDYEYPPAEYDNGYP